MIVSKRKHVGTVLMLAAVFLNGCGCTAAGCVNGLTVKLQSLPSAPFKIELLIGGVLQPTPESASCTGSHQCSQEAGFSTTASDNVAVRVTSPLGVRTTEFGHITYSDQHPNGEGCGPSCRNATVTAQIP